MLSYEKIILLLRVKKFNILGNLKIKDVREELNNNYSVI
jgi:hypothetical protein